MKYVKKGPTGIVGKVRGVAARILSYGLTPQKLALTLCFGISIGIMPTLWGTSVLCAAVAAVFRLNQGAIQTVNYACYPLQLALLLPFFRLGELLSPWGPRVSGKVFTDALHGQIAASAGMLGWATAKALTAWLITVLPLAFLAYPAVKALLLKKQAARLASIPDDQPQS